MGGHRAGEVASADTVEVLEGVADHRSLVDLVAAVHLANRRINDRAEEDEDLRGMGTTVCVVGLVDEDGDHLAVLNVGDSRVYLFADGELRSSPRTTRWSRPSSGRVASPPTRPRCTRSATS